jgi:hypothetical protein
LSRILPPSPRDFRGDVRHPNRCRPWRIPAPETVLEGGVGPQERRDDTVDEAVHVGNDTEYGLAAYVSGTDVTKIREVASKLRAGQVSINGGGGDLMAPFGGYKMSGNGREWGDYGFHEFLETKAMLGYAPPQAAE